MVYNVFVMFILCIVGIVFMSTYGLNFGGDLGDLKFLLILILCKVFSEL